MEWYGASGIVINDAKVLMVKTIHEEGWSIPSGGLEENESPDQAVIREIYEETGYCASISSHVEQFKKFVDNHNVTVDYYICQLEGGDGIPKDPDEEIEMVRWFTIDELDDIEWMYPEDQELIKQMLATNISSSDSFTNSIYKSKIRGKKRVYKSYKEDLTNNDFDKRNLYVPQVAPIFSVIKNNKLSYELISQLIITLNDLKMIDTVTIIINPLYILNSHAFIKSEDALIHFNEYNSNFTKPEYIKKIERNFSIFFNSFNNDVNGQIYWVYNKQ